MISLNPTDVPSGVIPITTSNSGPLAGSGSSVPLPPVSLRLINPKIGQAYSEFYSLSIEREVLKNSVLALEYSGSHGVHLYDLGNVNKTGFGSAYDPADTAGLIDASTGTTACASSTPGGDGTFLGYGVCRLLLRYGNANQRGSQGGSKYNSLNTRFTSNHLFNKGVTLNFNWTLVKDEVLKLHDAAIRSERAYQVSLEHWEAHRATHRVSIALTRPKAMR